MTLCISSPRCKSPNTEVYNLHVEKMTVCQRLKPSPDPTWETTTRYVSALTLASWLTDEHFVKRELLLKVSWSFGQRDSDIPYSRSAQTSPHALGTLVPSRNNTFRCAFSQRSRCVQRLTKPRPPLRFFFFFFCCWCCCFFFFVDSGSWSACWNVAAPCWTSCMLQDS